MTIISDHEIQMPGYCPVCGASSFTRHAVIWDELAAAWELSDIQRSYIDDQQGLFCDQCMCNLRSMTLASAIMDIVGISGTFVDCCMKNTNFRNHRFLEINEAGSLSPLLSNLPEYYFASYPEYDMQALKLPDESFDFIIHSDTLEHVQDSSTALCECYRVVKSGGYLVYTIPIIPDRITRSRVGLPPSYHGRAVENLQDYLVQREYGCDFWVEIFESGFRNVYMHSILYPASFAIVARK